jgi:HAD superfamily hydrolase (TIGR01509 family)
MPAQPISPFAVLWDLDGILVDTAAFHLQSWSEVLSAAGWPFSEDVFRRTFGMNNHGVLSTVMGRPPTAAELEQIAEVKEARFRAMIAGQARPLPGVRDWLARLQGQGARQAVASSAPMANIAALIDSLELRGCFQALVSAAGLPSKPDPAVFLEAALRLDVPPERCVVVEDAVAGVEAARRAGMRCLAVTNTNPASALSAADLVVDSLEHLPFDTLSRLLNRTSTT